MNWWRKIWHRLRGGAPSPAPTQLRMWEGPLAGAAKPLEPSEPGTPTLVPTPASGLSQAQRREREEPSPPVVDGPIATPPAPALPVTITPPEPAVTPAVLSPMLDLLEAPQVPIHTPVTRPDAPFELPDFSTIDYPTVQGGFASPLGSGRSATRSARQDAGTSRFGAHATGQLLDELQSAEQRLTVAVDGEPIIMSLPSHGSTAQTYAVASLPPQFLDDPQAQTPRTLSQALPSTADPSTSNAADALDRLELTRLVGILLHSLHTQELFTAGVDLDGFAFSLQPRPAIALLRGDHVRRVGGDFLSQTLSLDIAPSLDADRHAFAQLAHRMLVSPVRSGSLSITGLSGAQTRGAHRLWERSAGQPGTRPQLGEWMAVLGS